MKQYTFKDGTKVIASSVEEAKSKHKVVAKINVGDIKNQLADSLNKEYFSAKLDSFDNVIVYGPLTKFSIRIEEKGTKQKFRILIESNEFLGKKFANVVRLDTIEDVIKYCKESTKLLMKMEDRLISVRDTTYNKIKSLK